MSLTRKASSAAKKPTKPPRQDLAAALAEREAELAEARRQQAATAEILRVISRVADRRARRCSRRSSTPAGGCSDRTR